MIYTEEDLQQAYIIGYNEAVNDLDRLIDESYVENTEFSLDEHCDSYHEDYSAVEEIVYSESNAATRARHKKIADKTRETLKNKYQPESDGDLIDIDRIPNKLASKDGNLANALNIHQLRDKRGNVKDVNVTGKDLQSNTLKKAVERNKAAQLKKNAPLAIRGR